jgi:hypothetical protein
LESKLKPAPQWEAPEYRADGKLAGKVALITGGGRHHDRRLNAARNPTR